MKTPYGTTALEILQGLSHWRYLNLGTGETCSLELMPDCRFKAVYPDREDIFKDISYLTRFEIIGAREPVSLPSSITETPRMREIRECAEAGVRVLRSDTPEGRKRREMFFHPERILARVKTDSFGRVVLGL